MPPLFNMLPNLLQTALTSTLRDTLFTVAALSLTTHYIYNRWEPANVTFQFFLLAVVPFVLSIFVATHVSVFAAVPLTFLTYYATLCTSVGLYRLSPLHPLARYPGPIPNKISQFWMINVAMKGKRHVYIQRLHEKYGDIVRIGPNEVSIRDASAINPLMGTTGWPKGPNLFGVRWMGPEPMDAMIMVRNPVEHHRRRRPWNRAFSTAALKEYEPLVAKRVNQLVGKIASDKGVVDIAKFIGYFTYDFMGDMAFGGWYEMLRDGDADGRWKAMEDSLRATLFFEHIPWVTYWVQKLGIASGAVKKQRAFSLARADERYQQGSKTKDLFYYLNNDDGAEPEPPAKEQVVSDGNLAIIAGSDTTASVLSNIVYYLLLEPTTYKRLQQEVDLYYPPGEDATNTKNHTKMVFLEAVINEALRLLPAVPSGSQRAASPGSGGKAIGPYYLPEGTHARVHFYSVQRDPRNFSPHPESFWPDRWIVAEGDMPAPKDFKHNPTAFTPFSFGPYNCVGKNLALQEMRTVLCSFLQNLDLRFADGYDPEDWIRDIEDMFVVKKGRLPVIATRRTHNV
ncbi:unnamed protein product [Somion occarium]|uniref:Cytochrome P450 n=1 Tax=Somion occarium TaxID=3059160 RepID=A0ABP1DEZ4_9APHY